MKSFVRRMARLGMVSGVAALLAGGCVTGPDDTGQAEEALTVCHSTTVEGIDVSEFQGSINWSQVHASGREFAVARIGDGTYTDPTFARNWSGIRAAGMIRGAYLFFRPTVSATAQAAAINAAVGRLGPGDLPVTIDVECMCPASAGTCASSGPGCVSPATAANVLRALVAQVATDTGKTPMIYTGSWFWDGSTYLHDAITLPSNPLWVSGYTTGCVTVPAGWTDWRIWQYSDGTCAGCPVRGTPVPGVASSPSVDRDRFDGTLADLQNFANGGAQWGGQFVSQSFPYASVGTIQIHAGSSQAVTLTMRNIGTHAWDGNTRIGTTVPRDRSDPFVGPGWIGPNRPAGVPSGMTIPMGGMYAFQWTFYVPATMAPGRYDEHFGMLEEGVTWFSDPGQAGPPDNQLEAIVEVLAPLTPPDAGPMTDASTGDASMTDASIRDAANGDASDAGARDGSSRGDASARDASADGGPATTPPGCGCRTAGHSGSNGAVTLALVALAATVARRRRARS